MVIDDGVDEVVTHLRIVVCILGFSRTIGTMFVSMVPADEPPWSAVGNFAELGSVDGDGIICAGCS